MKQISDKDYAEIRERIAKIRVYLCREKLPVNKVKNNLSAIELKLKRLKDG